MSTEELRQYIRDIPDFPSKGVIFRDITPLLKSHEAFAKTVDLMAEEVKSLHITTVAAVEARGFIWGGTLAYRLGVGFVPIRKPGKLPYEVVEKEFQLEYGMDVLQIHKDAVGPGDSVLIVDDVLATGGTAEAAADLINSLKAEVAGFCFLLRLGNMGGYERLAKQGKKVTYLLTV
ncbi:adenine phosphoribosyltransferase [Coprothermobacter platensis]|uniref:adenine phosphoribosyltransferase n=1 Tax=Coprothermobacter platensis TaxID=108819 RepID=UPI000369B50D|nr:adenine phosphoribosyltransferase [Coprothermobacter platensis]